MDLGWLTWPVLLLAFLGLVLLAYVGVWFLHDCWMMVYSPWLGKTFGHTLDLPKLGPWAVVTGATDGIGKGYAQELARKGINIVLISRTLSKLQATAQEIENQFHVQTKVISADYTRTDIYDNIRKELEGLDIGILINNVGMSYEYPEYFLDVDGGDQQIINLINCNTMSCVLMSRMVMPGMVKKKKGAIVNLASTAAQYPMPFLNVYSATKVFVDYFSRALASEYRGSGVFIQSVIPFFVATNMSKIRKTSFTVPSPQEYARSALGTIGLENRTFGCLAHKIQGFCVEWLVHIFPYSLASRVMYGVMKDMNNRARHIKQRNSKKE